MDYLYLILGMAAVTYLPRLLPLVLLRNWTLSPFMTRFMHYIPYAVLAALIVPGVFNAVGNQTTAAVVGAVVALGLAYTELNLLVVVLGSVGSVLIVVLCQR